MSGIIIRFKKILVVDDDQIIRVVMQNLLRSIGCTVETAIDGVDALHKLETDTFDLVLSDINMPNMDGCELAASIRLSKKSFQHVPIIGVSANTRQEQLRRACEAGMSMVVAKPLSIAALKQLLLGFQNYDNYPPN